MRDKTISDQDLADLRVYPLEGRALFPHTVLPLKVREPALVQLILDCIAKDLPLVAWQVAGGGMPSGDPAERSDVATVGRVAIHHEVAEGGLDIVVEGLERVRVLEEFQADSGDTHVRVARHPLDEPDEHQVESRRESLKAMAFLLTGQHPRAAKLVRVTLGRLSCARELSDVLCSVSFDDGWLRQVLLQQSSVTIRLDQVIDSLAGLLLSASDSDHPFDLQPEFD